MIEQRIVMMMSKKVKLRAKAKQRMKTMMGQKMKLQAWMQRNKQWMQMVEV